jgi:hypothetical protein
MQWKQMILTDIFGITQFNTLSAPPATGLQVVGQPVHWLHAELTYIRESRNQKLKTKYSSNLNTSNEIQTELFTFPETIGQSGKSLDNYSCTSQFKLLETKDEDDPTTLQKYFQPTAQQITVSNPLNIQIAMQPKKTFDSIHDTKTLPIISSKNYHERLKRRAVNRRKCHNDWEHCQWLFATEEARLFTTGQAIGVGATVHCSLNEIVALQICQCKWQFFSCAVWLADRIR